MDLDGLEASLRLDQRRFQAAGRLLERAVRRARNAGLAEDLGRLLVKRSELRRQEDRLDDALDDARSALAILDPRRQHTLCLCALGTVALILCDAGRFDEAADVLDGEKRWWQETGDDWWSVRLHTLAGRVAFGRGSLGEAEECFALVLERYRERGQMFDAAVAALDLALVHLAAGRPEAAHSLAHDALHTFRQLDIEREGMAAMVLLEKAVRTRCLDRALLRHVHAVLESFSSQPEFGCQGL